MMLDMKNDRAVVFGKNVDLHFTWSGHYCLPLRKPEISHQKVREVLFTAENKNLAAKKKIIWKL
ncbi:hypothetical protein OV760_28625, partial [Salmonella enterica subsp. enterica serovar 1,4,[5],12:i:-]|nr:hypothetical protein [Salmonella enterica subsp. enterica serovar 1,4,[5],12:i:-]